LPSTLIIFGLGVTSTLRANGRSGEAILERVAFSAYRIQEFIRLTEFRTERTKTRAFPGSVRGNGLMKNRKRGCAKAQPQKLNPV